MLLSLLQENFNTALSHVSRFVSSKSQLPILNHLLLTTDSGRLKLSATNLEMGINYWIGAKIDTEGTLCLPAKDITEFVSYLPAGKIDLSLNSQNLLSVNSPKASSSFATLAPTDFPEIPSLDPATAFEFDSSVLFDSLSQVIFAAATDDTRPVLTAVLCLFSPQGLTLAATDGFRLSLKTVTSTHPEEQTLLIPAKSLQEILKLSKTNSTIKIGLTPDRHQVVFVLSDSELVSRLIEGDYPAYDRIIPTSSTTKVLINKDELAQSIRLASVFARQSANVVRFSVKNNSLELSANAPQVGQNQVSLDAKVEGDPLDIAFNYKFVSDFLAVAKGNEISLELNQSLTPGIFRDLSDPDFLHIIMPVRLQD